MTLITILFSLALQRFANVGGWMRPSWFELYLRRLQPWLIRFNEIIGIGIILAPILVLLLVLHLLLGWRFFGFFNLIFIVILLLFCIDARDYKEKLKDYFFSLEHQDQEAAASAATAFIGAPILYQANELPRAVTKVIFTKAFTDIFSVLFWYIVFGTYGAVGYLCLSLTSKVAPKVDMNFTNLARVAEQLVELLDWIPARLLGFSCALVGHFAKGFGYCIKNFKLAPKDNSTFIINAGLATLDLQSDVAQTSAKENIAAIDLINRVIIVWVVAVLLISLGYWL